MMLVDLWPASERIFSRWWPLVTNCTRSTPHITPRLNLSSHEVPISHQSLSSTILFRLETIAIILVLVSKLSIDVGDAIRRSAKRVDQQQLVYVMDDLRNMSHVNACNIIKMGYSWQTSNIIRSNFYAQVALDAPNKIHLPNGNRRALAGIGLVWGVSGTEGVANAGIISCNAWSGDILLNAQLMKFKAEISRKT